MNRKQALVMVRAMVAKDGLVDSHVMRIYVENRISRQSWDQACSEGMAIYHRKQKEIASTRVDEEKA